MLVLALAAATTSGWLAGRGNLAVVLAIGAAVPALLFGAQLRPVHWIALWLFTAGFLGRTQLPLSTGLPELTPERLVLVAALVFTMRRWFDASAWRGLLGPSILLVFFSADYLLMGATESPSFKDVALTYLHHYFSAFVIFILAAIGLRTPSERRTLGRTALVLGFLLAALALIQPLAGLDLGAEPGDWGGRIAGTLGSPPVLGASLASLLFLGLWEMVGDGAAWRLASVAACAVIGWAILFTFTRAAWLSVLGALAVIAIFALRRRPVLALGVLLIAAALIYFGPGLVDTLSDDPRLRDDANAIGRYQTSLLLWQDFTARPIAGWAPLSVTYFGANSGYADWVSHNSVLTLMVATGTIGTVLYLGPIVWSFGLGLLRPRLPISWRALAVAGAVAYVINALAIDMRYFSMPHTLFWLCLGLLAAAPPQHPSEET